MADVSVQMGVSGVGQFKSAMNEASASVKMLDTALKMNEQQLKSTGDKETYLQNKMVTLKAQIEAQTKVVKNAEQAWKTMLENGADPMSKAVVDMQSKYYAANTALMQMTDSLKALESGETQAATKANTLSQSLGGLNQKVSLEQVISGVNKITTGLENAGKKAVQLGETLFNEIMDKAQWADDSATMAMMYGVDLDTFLRVQKLVQNGMDTSVEAILKSQSKLKKNVGSGSDSFMETMKELGLAVTEYGGKVEEGFTRLVTQDSVDLFWQAGRAIMNLGDEYEQEAKAQELFGKSWRELIPLFEKYKTREEYQAALDSTITNTEDEVSALTDLNDKVGELKGNFDTLETKVLAGLAPALTKAADALSGLLGNVLEYLDSEEGQQALKDMGTAVSGLFDDLGKISPDQVVEGFAKVFGDIVNGITWISEHWGEVKIGIAGIGGAFLAMEGMENILTIVKLVDGLKGIAGGGAAAAGAAVGASWGGAFAAAVLAAAPWLLSIIAANAVPAENKLGNEARVENATYTENDIRRLRTWVELQNQLLQVNAAYGTSAFDVERFDLLSNMIRGLGDVQQGDLWSKYWDYLMANDIMPGMQTMPTDFMDKMFKEATGQDYTPPTIEVLPEPAPGTEEMIQEKLNQMKLTLAVEIEPFFGSAGGRTGGRGGGMFRQDEFHANGLPYVPFDGYHAILHKGERVLAAQQNRNYTANSNTYFEHVTVNNGMDADALAGRIAAAQQRAMSGFGS